MSEITPHSNKLVSRQINANRKLVYDDQTVLAIERMVESKLMPYQSVEDALFVFQAAIDLNVSLTFAMANFHVLDTKAGKKLTAGVHILSALIARNNVIIETIEDYVPVQHFNDNFFPLVLSLKEYVDGNYRMTTLDKIQGGEDFKGKRPIIRTAAPIIGEMTDRRTTIRLKWLVNNGTSFEWHVSEPVSYYLHEAFRAGYMDIDGKAGRDTYYQHTNAMIWKNAFTRAAKRGCSQYIGNLVETTELLEVENLPYEMDEDGNITLYDKDGKEVKTIYSQVIGSPNVTGEIEQELNLPTVKPT